MYSDVEDAIQKEFKFPDCLHLETTKRSFMY